MSWPGRIQTVGKMAARVSGPTTVWGRTISLSSLGACPFRRSRSEGIVLFFSIGFRLASQVWLQSLKQPRAIRRQTEVWLQSRIE